MNEYSKYSLNTILYTWNNNKNKRVIFEATYIAIISSIWQNSDALKHILSEILVLENLGPYQFKIELNLELYQPHYSTSHLYKWIFI